MKLKKLATCLCLVGCWGFLSAAEPISRQLINRNLSTGPAVDRIELTQTPFAQRIDLANNTITNRGYLFELRRFLLPAAGESPRTNLLWTQFVLKSRDPRERWSADCVRVPNTEALLVVISSGTSFSVYQISTNAVALPVPEQVTILGPRNADTRDSELSRLEPSLEMLIYMPQIDRVSITLEDEVGIVVVRDPRGRDSKFRLSPATMQWLSDQ